MILAALALIAKFSNQAKNALHSDATMHKFLFI